MKLRTFLLSLILLFVAVASTLTAQSSRNPFLVTANAGITGDTLSNGQSATYDLNTLLTGGQDFARDWFVSATVTVDSLSGATGGTISYQVSNAPASATTNIDWVEVESQAFNGPGSTVYLIEYALHARRARVVVTASGVQSSALRFRATAKDLTGR